ncbi:hypothetical protein UFOVP219_12 [uncultured Caudovirales phage]|uniref:Uncharacterized protein n=1 Tax=uncultured Caudovirales phage TaxID=2100421 RepID=A0A6J7WK14_9CAUD|nr:hypothetical protein UFOVP219_12 [uncultured Caudovirales phage]
MCQVSSFNSDHEKCIQGCNCCKSKDSAAAVSATLAERERIIKLLEEHAHPEAEAEYLIECDLCGRYYGVGLAIALIKGEK